MSEPRQGEVWWADAPEPVGRRPLLVLTRSIMIPRLANITVAPLTTRDHNIPSEVRLSRRDGFSRPCVISLDNVMTFPKEILDWRVVALSDEKMLEVWEAIRFAFDMPW